MKARLIVCVLIFLNLFCSGGEYSMTTSGLFALEKIAVWLYLFKESNSRLPQSLNDLIENTPSVPPDRITNLFTFYQTDCKYEISYMLIASTNIEIVVKDKNLIYLLKNEKDKYTFYRGSKILFSYFRNREGNIINRQEYFTNIR
jgi:hypothetical protein